MPTTLISQPFPTAQLAPKSTARNLMIDCAKGIGILLIILMHMSPFGAAFPTVSNVLFACVVLFFFGLSGVTFSLGDGNLWRIMGQRADGLLKPCLVVLFFLGIVRLAGGRASIEEMLVSLTYLTGFTSQWPPLWFLPHLWIVSVFSAALLIYGKPLFERKWRQVLTLLVMLALGYCTINWVYSTVQNPSCSKIIHFKGGLVECGLPLSADMLMLTSAFFLGGHLLAKRLKTLSGNFTRLILTGALLYGCSFFLKDRVDLNSRLYPYLVLTPLIALLGSYFILQLAYYSSKIRWLAEPLSYCGNASLFILIFHTPVLAWMLYHLPQWIASPLVVDFLSFAIPVLSSVALYAMFRRNRFLAAFLLPIRRRSAQTA